MVKDKIIPFTELDNEQMMKFRNDIFTEGFIEAMDHYENELMKDEDVEVKRKIFDFMIDLCDNYRYEDCIEGKQLIHRSILYGFYWAMVSCYWGLSKFQDTSNKDKVK